MSLSLKDLYRARHNFVNCFTVAVKLRKEFKIDNPEQAQRSSRQPTGDSLGNRSRRFTAIAIKWSNALFNCCQL
ncbi:MAG: hypothetical protein LBK96_06500 [Prevotellaceae bacterium]|nr:hypothetical protein [Prevotellaceae bacterium]